ncbi:hypothetical protein LSAT2_023600 [Lamellibrachia satsuma]|nr:hypothetical protein LSAT2_023600 [Lamellibrachia satsuma]
MSDPSGAFAWKYDIQMLKCRPRPFKSKKPSHLVEDSRKRPLITCRSDVSVTTINTKLRTGTPRTDSPRTDTSRYSWPAIPECLDTFSEFYNPATPANERFEKYLQEMDRRKQEDKPTKSSSPSRQLALVPSTENDGRKPSSYTVLPKIELTAPSSADVAHIIW